MSARKKKVNPLLWILGIAAVIIVVWLAWPKSATSQVAVVDAVPAAVSQAAP